MKKLLALLLCGIVLGQSGCCRGRLLRWRPFAKRNCETQCRESGCHTACQQGCCEGHTQVHSAPSRVPYSPVPTPYNAVPVPNNTLPPPGDGTLPE